MDGGGNADCGHRLDGSGVLSNTIGIIHDSVLWFFAQCLIYAGSIFGVSIYVTGKVNKAITDFKQREEGDDKQQQ